MNLVIWLLVLGSFEFAYKRSLIKEEQFNYPTKVITIEEFESRVIKGEKLVLVDAKHLVPVAILQLLILVLQDARNRLALAIRFNGVVATLKHAGNAVLKSL